MIDLYRPWTNQAELAALERVLRSGWLTFGPEVLEFEREFKTFVQAPFACAVSSCSAGLEMALRAIKVRPGDEIILASYAHIAAANAIHRSQATPVFVDVRDRSYNIDPDQVQAAITSKTRAVLVTHQFGLPADLGALVQICKVKNLLLIEDAASALGSEIMVQGRWQKIGSPQGDIACFSFHPGNLLTTGEGGMVTTRHRDFYEFFQLWRCQGSRYSDLDEFVSDQALEEHYEHVGSNVKMSDLQAAIGREQLKKLPQIIETRRRLADRYLAALEEELQVILPFEPNHVKTNWQSFAIELTKGVNTLSLRQQMLRRSIATRRGCPAVHLQNSFSWASPRHPLLNSERLHHQSLLLPIYYALTKAEQDQVIDTLKQSLSSSDKS